MPEALPPVLIELKAIGSDLSNRVKEAKAELGDLEASGNRHMEGLAKAGKFALLGIAGAAIAVGGTSLKMGIDFQAATTQLVTGAGESEANIKLVRDGLLNMAPAVGMGPVALAKAMFLVESAGYHGAAGLQVMKAAAEGAKIGGADATVVANGLTTALTDYHLSAAQAADTTSKLIATVAAGKTNMTDLSSSLSAVLPSAAAAHIGLSQVLGAMGTMTGEGISAQQSAQNLAGTIRSLSNPSAVASHEMAQMGLNSTTVAQQLGKKGLTGTLAELTTAITSHMGPAGLVLQSSFNQSTLAAQSAQTMLKQLPKSLQHLGQEFLNNQITAKQWTTALKGQDVLTSNLGKQFSNVAKHAHGFSDILKSGSGAAQTYNAALSNMTGGATGLNTALALTGGNSATFAGNVAGIGKASTEAGGHVKGWATTQEDLATKIDQAKAAVEAIATKIGMALIPYVEKAITATTKIVSWLQQHSTVAKVLAGVIGGVLVAAITTWGVMSTVNAAKQVAAGVRVIASWVAQGAAAVSTGAVLAAVWLSEQADRAAAVAGAVAGAAVQVGAWIATAAAAMANAVVIAAAWLISMGPIILVAAAVVGLGILIATHMSLIKGWIGAAWTWVKNTTESIWNGIKAVLSTVWGWIKTAVMDYFNAYKLIITTAFNIVRAVVVDVWNGILATISGVVTGVRSVLGWFGQLGSLFGGWFGNAYTAVTGQLGNLLSFVGGLPGRILSELGDLGSLLLGAGKNIVQGLIDGISSMAGTLVHALLGILPGPLQKFAGMLGIASPSKVFAGYGLNIVQGLIAGIDGHKPALAHSMGHLAAIAGAPMGGVSPMGGGAVSGGPGAAARTVPSSTGSRFSGGRGGNVYIQNYNEAHHPPELIAADLAHMLRTAG